MKKFVSALAAISILSFGLFGAGSYAEKMATEGWHIYEVKQLLNYGVRNHQGEYPALTHVWTI
jgi:hypothetical protein